MLFNIFNKKPVVPFPELLVVDIHSHLIPGIDDGSPNIEQSLFYLKQLQNFGYKKVITTPHVMESVYPNTTKIIQEGLELLKNASKENGLEIEIEASAEYFLDANFVNQMQNGDILSFGAENYLLFEFSFVAPNLNFNDILFQMQAKGYTPILAHPERYNYWHNNEKVFKNLKDKGLMMQVNVSSLLGYYGVPIKNWAQKLIKLGYIDFLGTDLHHERHLQMIEKNRYNKEINKIIKENNFKNNTLFGAV